jgi:hypothetical protein
MPSIAETVKPTPVPRCPDRHRPFLAGCRRCRRWAVYQRLLGIWERAHGVNRSYVASDETRAHLHALTTTGNRTIADIAAKSGVSDNTIRFILAGTRTRLYPLTAQSLLAIPPAPARAPLPPSNHVAATEGIRLMRGMFAQGWSWPHIADLLGGVTAGAAQYIGGRDRPWMLRETLDRIRVVARELGPFDIHDLPHPMPGMDIRCANRAVKNGWFKLSDWEGLDIADPAAVALRRSSSRTPAPAATAAPGRNTSLVSSLEATRIVRGLLAQAWTPVHMAGLLGYRTDRAVLEIARPKRQFMRPESREAVRGLADKLGPYNGILMTDLLPGMDLTVADNAADRGFVPLAAWAGQDLADPDAVPGRRPPAPAGIPADDTGTPRGAELIIPVDEVKKARLRSVYEQILATDRNGTRRPDGYIRQLGDLTRLEQHVLTSYATHLGMSAAEVAEALGYPSATPKQVESGQRGICRILFDVRSAMNLIKKHPAGRVPSWLLPTRDIQMSSYLPALLAMQQAPVGLGMTVEQLAAWCGATEDVMHQYLARAAPRVNATWKPQPHRRRQAPPRCSPNRPYALTGGSPA